MKNTKTTITDKNTPEQEELLIAAIMIFILNIGDIKCPRKNLLV